MEHVRLQPMGEDLIPAAAALACKLWPDNDMKELMEEFKSIGGDSVILLAMEGKNALGFAQCSLRRDYVEGTSTSPVGYLEAIYVLPEYRGQGLARRLLDACEGWALGCGCQEFASDCELENTQSLKFHLGAGFREANRIICFAKKLKKEEVYEVHEF